MWRVKCKVLAVALFLIIFDSELSFLIEKANGRQPEIIYLKLDWERASASAIHYHPHPIVFVTVIVLFGSIVYALKVYEQSI